LGSACARLLLLQQPWMSVHLSLAISDTGCFIGLLPAWGASFQVELLQFTFRLNQLLALRVIASAPAADVFDGLLVMRQWMSDRINAAINKAMC